jgi:hypothetical protein
LSPSALTNKINYLAETADRGKISRVCAVSANALLHLRHAVAFPVYVVALVVLSFLSDALGILAAKIAGDNWRRDRPCKTIGRPLVRAGLGSEPSSGGVASPPALDARHAFDPGSDIAASQARGKEARPFQGARVQAVLIR